MRFIRCEDGSLVDLDKFGLLFLRPRSDVAANDENSHELVGFGMGLTCQIAKGSRTHCELVRDAIAKAVSVVDPLELATVAAEVLAAGPPVDDEDGGRRAD